MQVVIAYPSGERKVLLNGDVSESVKNLALRRHKLAWKSLLKLPEINKEVNEIATSKIEDEIQILCTIKPL